MKYIIFLIALTFIACKTENQGANKTPIKEQETANQAADENDAYSGKLVHTVYLNLRDDVDSSQLRIIKDAVIRLRDIPEVKELNIGSFEDLGDKRAMSNLELVFTMGFSKRQDYTTYQNHPIHLELKGKIKDFLSGPPVTYDYWAQ